MVENCIAQTVTDNYAVYCGDCCEVIKSIPDASIGLSLFSPPFANLFCYSNNERDMGNSRDYNEFFSHFSILVEALFRIMKPGRIVAVHCMDIPAMLERDGYIGLKDFPGDLIRCFCAQGFIYHGRVVIWKDPLIEATRTKAIGLMHKQLKKDSAICRQGLPDYLLSFRTPGENTEPIAHPDGLTRYVGKNDPTLGGGVRSHNIWRAYASPVWMDIRQTRTLNKGTARDPEDERHICPLQMDVIERAIILWSNAGDRVFSPFAGIGSELFGAVLNDRKAIGIELKESYYRQAVRNLAEIKPHEETTDMFSELSD